MSAGGAAEPQVRALSQRGGPRRAALMPLAGGSTILGRLRRQRVEYLMRHGESTRLAPVAHALAAPRATYSVHVESKTDACRAELESRRN